MARCLICTLNATADLYSLGLIKRNTRMKIRESEEYSVYSPALCMWNEKGGREQSEEGAGRWWPVSCWGCPNVLPCPNREAVDSGPQAGHIQITCQGIWDQEIHMWFPASGNARGAVSAIVEISNLGTGSSCQKITLRHDRKQFFFVEKVCSGCILANWWSWGVAEAKRPFLITIQS